MARKILLVDDEPLILKGLKYSLEQDGYLTDSAMDGEEALAKFFAGEYDLILLDVMLPGLDGIEVCQRIRERSNVPIIMLTAKGEDMDKILGLEYGADDYMTKPFNILEVKARIKSILRRAGAHLDDAPPGGADAGLQLTKTDLFLCGLSGAPDSAARRQALLDRLGLPRYLSAAALLTVVNATLTREEWEQLLSAVCGAGRKKA